MDILRKIRSTLLLTESFVQYPPDISKGKVQMHLVLRPCVNTAPNVHSWHQSSCTHLYLIHDPTGHARQAAPQLAHPLPHRLLHVLHVRGLREDWGQASHC